MANALSALYFSDEWCISSGGILDRLTRFTAFLENMDCPHCHGQVGLYAKHCKRCGGAIPPGQYLLEEAGVIEPALSASARTRTSALVRKAERYRFARLGDRFLAFVLDTAFLFGLFAVVDAWAFMRWATFDGAELQLTAASLLIAITLNAAILFLYGWLLEAGCGATLGKALVGIRIVGTSERSQWSASAIRNVLRILDGLGFYLVGTAVAACSDVRQRIGDVIARTAVVEESFGIGIRLTAIVLWMATLAGAGWAVPRLCAAKSTAHSRYLSQIIVRVGRNGNSAYFRVAGFTVDVHCSTAP